MTNSQNIFSGITTSELIGYYSMGDTSVELMTEIKRRLSIESKQRVGKANIVELDAKYNG